MMLTVDSFNNNNTERTKQSMFFCVVFTIKAFVRTKQYSPRLLYTLKFRDERTYDG